MPKICDMVGVREYGESDPVELWRNDENGRLVIRVRNEGGYSFTDVDLWDIIKWIQAGPGTGVVLVDGPSSDRNNVNPARD
jgi:hypothetical protein